MSASAKKPAFPLNCASAACAKALSGPVAFCPYCGASSQVVAAAPAAPAPLAMISSAPVAVATAVPAAMIEAEHETAPAPVADAPVVKAIPATPAPVAPPVAKSSNLGRKLALAAGVVVAVVGYGAYQASQRQSLQQFETELAAGQGCLRSSQFNCALEKAESALRIESKDPRAISLLQRAQAGLEGQQRDQQAKTQAAAAAASAAAARQAAAEQAQREQQARELAAKEQRLRDEQDQLAKRQQQLEQQARVVQPTQQRPVTTTRPPAQRSSAAAANAGLVGQQLTQARSALARRDGATARSLANRVLSQDPGNRQAQIILRQAEQLRGQSFNTPKGLGGVIIE